MNHSRGRLCHKREDEISGVFLWPSRPRLGFPRSLTGSRQTSGNSWDWNPAAPEP